MAEKVNDPLLIFAKAIIYLMLGLMMFAGFFVLLGIPAVAIFGADLGAELDAAELPQHAMWLIALLLAGVAGMLYLGIRFFLHMLRIVQSVGDGDPFEPVNNAINQAHGIARHGQPVDIVARTIGLDDQEIEIGCTALAKEHVAGDG